MMTFSDNTADKNCDSKHL